MSAFLMNGCYTSNIGSEATSGSDIISLSSRLEQIPPEAMTMLKDHGFEAMFLGDQQGYYFIEHVLAKRGLGVNTHTQELGVQVYENTGKLLAHANLEMPQGFPIGITPLKSYMWHEGLFTLDLSWHERNRTNRIYSLGLEADERGRAVIKRVQKHWVGIPTRSDTEARTWGNFEEKKHADIRWREIVHDSGYPGELFGFLATALTFGPHATKGEIVFPTPNQQFGVIDRRQYLEYVAAHPVAGLSMEDAIKKVEGEIAMIQERTDYASMLAQMGVQTEDDETIRGYKKTTIDRLLQGVHSRWTDDTGNDRHLLRKILYTLYQLQSM